ncbi:MAG TPA: hypothetical protein VGD53_11130 [Actinoallomurus sp.]
MHDGETFQSTQNRDDRHCRGGRRRDRGDAFRDRFARSSGQWLHRKPDPALADSPVLDTGPHARRQTGANAHALTTGQNVETLILQLIIEACDSLCGDQCG